MGDREESTAPPSSTESERLARDLLDGNLAEYREFLLHLVKASFPRRHQQAFDPSDVVQEALLRAHRGIATARARCDAQMRAWLVRILVNTLRNFIRKEEGRDLLADHGPAILGWLASDGSGDLMASLVAANPTPGAFTVSKEFLECLSDALLRLTPAQREVFLLRFGEGLKMREIAARIDKTLPSITGLLQHALAKLRTILIPN